MALALERDATVRFNCEAVMWKITTRGFALEEVLIMAAMNLLASAAPPPKTRETGVAEIKRRPRSESYAPRITERHLPHGVVQCNHCNCSQFHSARFECVKRHSGMLCAYLIFVGAMKYFGGHMAKIIEFYTPQSFRKVSKWLPPAERGKMLAFPLAVRKSA